MPRTYASSLIAVATHVVRTATLAIAASSGAMALALACASGAMAQTVADPQQVAFAPSPDHSTVIPGVGNAVSDYMFEIYMAGASSPFHSVSMGKPAPQSDGLIHYVFGSTVAGWPLPGGVYESRVAAVGPTGAGRSTVSNQFTFSTQAPTCSTSVSPGAIAATAAGLTQTLTVTAPAGCAWTASSGASWVTLSASGGTGPGSITVVVAANALSTARSTQITVGGLLVNVSQGGVAASCAYTITPATFSPAAAGGTQTVTLDTADPCTWTASTAVSWLTLSVASGKGASSVVLAAAANPSSLARSTTATIAGQTVTVTQAGVPCTTTLSPTSLSVVAGGGTSTIAATLPGGCSWTASSSVAWMTVSPASGSGTGSVTVTVAANTSTSSRTATVTIGGQTVTVTQAAPACSFSVSPTSVSLAGGGGSKGVSLTTTAGCKWTASASASWISLSSKSGTGSATVTVKASANLNSPTRTGTVTIGGKTVSVSQVTGCSYTVSPATWSAGSGSVSKKVSISTTSACSWTVKSAASWIAASPLTGKANGSTTLTVTANTGASRTGTVNVAGKTVTVTQAAKTLTAPIPTSSSLLSTTSAASKLGPAAGSDDADADGLPDDWELLVGLRADSAAGDDGSRGDPDGDGVDNATELANGTHPRGDAQYTRYLSFPDGAQASAEVAVANTGASAAHVWIRGVVNGGTAQTAGLIVEPRSRSAATLAGLAGSAAAIVVESDAVVVAERVGGVIAGGVEPSAGAAAASPHWAFAAGTTRAGYDVVLRLRNDAATAVDAKVVYVAELSVSLERTYSVPAAGEVEILVSQEADQDGSTPLADTNVSIVVEASAPVFAERVLVETQATGSAVEVSRAAAGAIAASDEWFFAELPTGPFDQFLTVANVESAGDAQIEATYTVGGRSFSRTLVLAPGTRQTIAVDAEAFGPSRATPLASASVAIAVASTNGVPVVAERATQWTTGGAVTGVSNVGVQPGVSWVVADAAVDANLGRACQLFVINTTAVPARLRVTVLPERGSEASTTVSLPAAGRITVDVARTFGVAQGTRFAVLVESVGATPAPVVVEHDGFEPRSAGQPALTRVMATRVR